MYKNQMSENFKCRELTARIFEVETSKFFQMLRAYGSKFWGRNFQILQLPRGQVFDWK